MEKNQALQLWKSIYGDKEIAYDYAGQVMKIDDFEDENSNYGWTFDFIKPLSSGGTNVIQNLIPTSLIAKHIRGEKPSFKIGNGVFEVRKGRRYGTFALYDVTDRNHPLDMTPTASNQDPEYNHQRQKLLYGKVQSESNFVLPSLNNIKRNLVDSIDIDLDTESQPETTEEVKTIEEIPAVEETAKTIETKVLQPEEPVEDETSVEEEQPVEETAVVEEAPVDLEASDTDEEDEPQVIEPTTHEVIVTEEEEPETVEPDSEKEAIVEEPVNEPKEVAVEEQSSKPEEEIDPEFSVDPDTSLFDMLDTTEKSLREENKLHDESKLLYRSALADIELLKQKENRLTDTLNAAYKALEDEKNKNRELVAINTAQAKDNAELSSKCDELIASIEEKDNSILVSNQSNSNHEHELLSQIEALKKEKEELNNSIVELNSSIEEKTNSISVLESEKESIKNEKESLQAENEKIAEENNNSLEKISKLEGEKDSLGSALTLKDSEIMSLKDEKDNLDHQIAELNKKIEEVTGKYNLVTTSIGEKDSRVTDLENENESLKETVSQYLADKNELSEQIEKLKEEKDNLIKDNEQSEAQSSLVSDQLASLNFDIEALRKQVKSLEDEKAELSKANDDYRLQKESDDKEHQRLLDAIDENEKQVIAYKTEKETAVADKTDFYNKTIELNLELKNKNEEIDTLKSELDTLKKNSEDSEESNNTAIGLLQKQNSDLNSKLLFVSLGGDINKYSEFEFYLADEGKESNKDNIDEALNNHPTWRRREDNRIYDVFANVSESEQGIPEDKMNVVLLSKEDVSYINKEKETKDKALNYWAMKFGEDLDHTTDFAGRVIYQREFNNPDSDYGWNYRLFNIDERESNGNVFIANLRTLPDYSYDKEFTSNGQKFKVCSDEKGHFITSDEFVTDPYDLYSTLKITKTNENTKKPLIYIFVKCVSASNNSLPDKTHLLQFFDLIDRTVKRTCSKSFLEMKTSFGKNKNYAFLTFDGTIEGAYKEAFDYSVLLNSYRNEIKKEKDGINAYIVLNQTEVTFSQRHLQLEELISATNDVELRSLHFEFAMSEVVSSLVKKNLHIGPSIIDHLPVEQSTLKPSNIGHTEMFSTIYSFNKNFFIYNYVFPLKTRIRMM